MDDIRFSPEQGASFMDKMHMLFPETAARTGEDGSGADAEPETAAVGVAQPELPLLGKEDAVAAVLEPEAAPADPAPAMELDLGPAFAAVAGLMGSVAPAGEGANSSFKVRVAQDNGEIRLTIPKQAVEFLKGLRPLLEAVAKLGG